MSVGYTRDGKKGLQSVVNPGKAGKEERKIEPLP